MAAPPVGAATVRLTPAAGGMAWIGATARGPELIERYWDGDCRRVELVGARHAVLCGYVRTPEGDRPLVTYAAGMHERRRTAPVEESGQMDEQLPGRGDSVTPICTSADRRRVAVAVRERGRLAGTYVIDFANRPTMVGQGEAVALDPQLRARARLAVRGDELVVSCGEGEDAVAVLILPAEDAADVRLLSATRDGRAYLLAPDHRGMVGLWQVGPRPGDGALMVSDQARDVVRVHTGHDGEPTAAQLAGPASAFVPLSRAARRFADAAAPGGGFQLHDCSPDGRFWLASQTTSSSHTYHLWDALAEAVTEAAEAPLPPTDVDIDRGTAASSDGLAIPWEATRPRGQIVGTVLRVHGGPWLPARTAGDAESRVHATRGWCTLDVSYRGTPGFGLPFKRAGAGQWAGRVLDDLAAAVRTAGRGPMVAVGESFGGLLARLLSHRQPGLVTGVVAVSSPLTLSSWSAWLRRDQQHPPCAAAVGDISDEAEAYPAVPTLFIHSFDDQRAPYRAVDAYSRRAKAAGAPVAVAQLRNAAHALDSGRAQAVVLQLKQRFLDARRAKSEDVL